MKSSDDAVFNFLVLKIHATFLNLSFYLYKLSESFISFKKNNIKFLLSRLLAKYEAKCMHRHYDFIGEMAYFDFMQHILRVLDDD